VQHAGLGAGADRAYLVRRLDALSRDVTRLSLSSTFAIFGAAVAALALFVALQAWRARPAGASSTAQPLSGAA
jgi:hypothetical protein